MLLGVDNLGISAKARMSCAGTMTNAGRRFLSAIIHSRFSRLSSASVSAVRRLIQGAPRARLSPAGGSLSVPFINERARSAPASELSELCVVFPKRLQRLVGAQHPRRTRLFSSLRKDGSRKMFRTARILADLFPEALVKLLLSLTYEIFPRATTTQRGLSASSCASVAMTAVLPVPVGILTPSPGGRY